MSSKHADESLCWRAVVRQYSEEGTGSIRPSKRICEGDVSQGDTTSTCPRDSNINRPSCQRICKYDVFLSFRGTDTRNTFVDHLYHHFIRKGLFVFKDDKGLKKGRLISQQLVQAIKDSRVSIIVFSKSYATSAWCLDEMATIAKCHKLLKQSVFPIFYDVDPSHVRNQNGVYEKAFVLHTKKFQRNPGKVDQWKRAMTGLARLVGWDIRNKSEFGEIENIVQTVIQSLGHKFSGFADDLVGIQPRVEALESLLKLNSDDDDFRVLGIWGMGGIGKTILANALYDRISYQFDASCFIEDVSKICRDGGAVVVQKQIIHQTLDEINPDTCSPSEISRIVRNRLRNIKVLLILDNIDQLEQLEMLAINPKSLCKGSRMIITTRDEHILKVFGAHGMYKVPLLRNNDAHELFCKKAFKSGEQNSICAELIPEVLKYAQCLPLAIKVVSSSLCSRDAIQWKDALDRLQKNPDNKIMDVLQISVDGLHPLEKEIFLHIACFFKGEREDYVKRILDSCRLHPHIGIPSLVEKSLIIIRNEEIHMHDMLQELGKKIVRHKYLGKPGRWSRIWLYEDFFRVLMAGSGTDHVEAIVLRQNDHALMCWADGLSKMKNLKLLILYQNRFLGTPFLSNRLQYLFWHGYPFASLPSNFEPYYLVELNMPDSHIQLLWEGRKDLAYLKRVDLSNSKYLMETPNFEGCQRLERLDLSGCTNLRKLHPSIGLLGELVFLGLQNCSNLVSIDFGSVSNLSSLTVLHLSGCTKLENTPNFRGALNLEYLDIDHCSNLSTVHESIGTLTKLKFLSLRDCKNLVWIPRIINTMTSLITLDFHGCLSLLNLPLRNLTSNSSSCLEYLVFLDVSFCKLVQLPDAIGELWCLERLNLQGNDFDSIPSTISKLSCLSYLNLAHCCNLQSFPKLPVRSASSVGRYFKTVSGSRDHRSGLYAFNCRKVTDLASRHWYWLLRLLKEPSHFRCGFDIVAPLSLINTDSERNRIVPKFFNHRFNGDSIIRIVNSDMDDNWIGFAFFVAFKVNYLRTKSSSSHRSLSSPLPHPFYLSFESEYTEERFDMPLKLELGGLKHFWIIFISREHCHFVKTGAHITFKAQPGLKVKKWGLRRVTKEDIKVIKRTCIGKHPPPTFTDSLVIDHVRKDSCSSSKPKIQLPYNWLVNEGDEVENLEAKAKENNLSNLGLQIGQSQ